MRRIIMVLKIIHIGVGIRGRQWLQLVKDYPEMTSVACVDADSRALDEAKSMSGFTACQYFNDVGTALCAVEADAALIASPSSLHTEHALKALETGLAVMIEKPFASNVEEASHVIRCAAELGKPVLVAEQFRFVPAERTVRELVQDGMLGEISSVTFVDRRRMPSHTQGAWMATMKYPQLQEIAVHHFDSLRSFFTRRPISVMARVWNPPWSDYQHGACTEAMIEMEGGLHIQYLGTLTSHRYAYSVWIEGEHGVLWTNRKLVMWRAQGRKLFWPVKRVRVPKGDDAPFPREGSISLLNSLRDALLHGKKPETSGDDNIWTLAMVEAGKRSVAEGRLVSIEEVLTHSTLPRKAQEEVA
jgi:predicted dehydrogenase